MAFEFWVWRLSPTRKPSAPLRIDMSEAKIAVIDTGICNLRSVTKALEAVGAAIQVVHTPEEVSAAAATGLVLPGVGALQIGRAHV